MSIGNSPIGFYPVGYFPPQEDTIEILPLNNGKIMTIPVSQIVQVNPGVLSSGGDPISLNGVLLSNSTYVPTGQVLGFQDSDSVSLWFGEVSTEYKLSQIYFQGYDNSAIKPDTLYVAPCATSERHSWLKSRTLPSDITSLGLAAGTDTGTILLNSVSTDVSLTLTSGDISYATIASKLATAIIGATATFDSIQNCIYVTNETGTDTINFLTHVSGAQTHFEKLKLTSGSGAILSQGIPVSTFDTVMDNVVHNTQNWATFTTSFEPVKANKLLLANWANLKNSRYMYVMWDSDTTASGQNSTAAGVTLKTAKTDGVMCISGSSTDCVSLATNLATESRKCAAFVMGMFASVDYTRLNGRITAAFRSQSGLLPTVINGTESAQLLLNGYSFYGNYGVTNNTFNFFYDGNLPSKWVFANSFIDQIYLNNQLQLAMIVLLQGVGFIPYNDTGYSLIRAGMQDPINQGINNGTIEKGVSLSESQKAQLKNAAGKDISSEIQNFGYYLQILDPGSIVRGQRKSPIINFWYTSGGAVQQITIPSILVQ